MPTITTTISNADMPDTIAAFSQGWNEGDNITRLQHAKREMRNYYRSTVKSYRANRQVVNEPDIEVT